MDIGLLNFKAKILLVFSLFTPSVTNKKPRYSKEELQAILYQPHLAKSKKRSNSQKLSYFI